MAGVSEMVRRMDYQKRAKKDLGVKRAESSTKIQELSTYVKSANEREVDILQSAVRKMEADEKQFKDVHRRELSTVKKFGSTVHTKSTDFNKFSVNGSLPSSREIPAKKSDDRFGRRGSLVFPATQSSSTNQNRRHSVQPDTSKYGRSFRKLKDAITPAGPKCRISPELVSKPKVKPGTSDTCDGRMLLVAEAIEGLNI